MSLVVAIPFGVASAVAYGGSTAVQHAAAHTGTGQADAHGLLRLLRDPRWLLSIGGDTAGFALQVVALANGPVVLIQPLMVLSLPVSLFIRSALDNTRPRRSDYLACLGIIAGLTVFFLALGTPAGGTPPGAGDLAWVLAGELAGAGALTALVRGRSAPLRAAVYGGVAGVLFGTLGVLVNALSAEYGVAGWRGLLSTPEGLLPAVGLAAFGLVGMVLTQVSFQVGALGAGLPANLAADPLAAVVLGAVLLDEPVPTAGGRPVLYGVCLLAVLAGAIRLASGTATGDATPVAPGTGPGTGADVGAGSTAE